jgi:hypothetical protein
MSAQDASISRARSIVDECFICMESVTGGMMMPCCWTGSNRAHKECLARAMWSIEPDDFSCPLCRTSWATYCSLLEDEAHEQFPERQARFLKFMRAMAVPERLMPLLSGIYVDQRIVLLRERDQTDFFHSTTAVARGSCVNPTVNPLVFDFVQPFVDDNGAVCSSHRITSLRHVSFEGDEIHNFVQSRCAGRWPPRRSKVRIDGAEYTFVGFHNDFQARSASALLDNGRDEPFHIPLASVVSFQLLDCHILSALGMTGKPWQPVEAIIMYRESATRCWVERIDYDGTTPHLVVGFRRDQSDVFRLDMTRVAYLMAHVQPRNPVNVTNGPPSADPEDLGIFLAKLYMKPSFTHVFSEAMNTVIVLGYHRTSHRSRLEYLMAYSEFDGKLLKIEVSQIRCLQYMGELFPSIHVPADPLAYPCITFLRME